MTTVWKDEKGGRFAMAVRPGERGWVNLHVVIEGRGSSPRRSYGPAWSTVEGRWAAGREYQRLRDKMKGRGVVGDAFQDFLADLLRRAKVAS